jgi:hypothetical protein
MNFINSIRAIWLRLHRFCRRRVRLFLYFIILIAVVGNAGTLISWGQWVWGSGEITALAVLRSFATYTIAIAATSFADCFLRRSESDNRTSLLLWFGLMCAAIGAGTVVLSVNSGNAARNAIYISAILAACIWFAANGRNPNLVEPTAYSTLGGENPLTEQ